MRKAAPTPVTVALLSDFGIRDHYAGVMKGVIAALAPQTSIIDITHSIPPQQVAAGAIALAQAWRYFPPRTIFLAVVDPGVGTARLPIAISTKSGASFIGPDNGLLAPAAQAANVQTIVELREPRYRLPQVSSTFHGRDIFAPAAGWLARGISISRLGPKLSQMVSPSFDENIEERDDELIGRIIYIDTYGNLITNLARERVEQFARTDQTATLSVRVGTHRRPLAIANTYAEVASGAPLALYGSFGHLEIAVRDGDAGARFKAGLQLRVVVRKTRS